MQYGGHDGHKVHPKPPGPFGPPTPNYKCEKTEETLFVTKVDFTSDEKCFTVFSVDCIETYDVGKVMIFQVIHGVPILYLLDLGHPINL